MNWIKQSDQEPTMNDMPFVTHDGTHTDLWDDTDFFFELTEKERLSWTWWMKLEKPK